MIKSKVVYICPHAAEELIFGSFYLPKICIRELLPTGKHSGNLPKDCQNLQPRKISASPELSSPPSNCMFTEDRAIILEGLANCQENTPVTLTLRVKQTNEVGDVRLITDYEQSHFAPFAYSLERLYSGQGSALIRSSQMYFVTH